MRGPLHTIESNFLKGVHCNALCMPSHARSGEQCSLLNINGMLIRHFPCGREVVRKKPVGIPCSYLKQIIQMFYMQYILYDIIYIYIYYTTCEKSSANMGFRVQIYSDITTRQDKWRKTCSLIYLCNCRIINNLLHRQSFSAAVYFYESDVFC